MKAEIIAVGNELLSGDTVNTDGAYLARALTLAGFEVHRQTVVPDDAKEIAAATTLALTRSHVIVFCGGLGPTKDDLTKETVAAACRLRLVPSAEAEQAIRDFFAERGRTMTDNNLKQALIIEGGEILKNDNGTAPGLFVQSRRQAIVLLPGPPHELEPMVEHYLLPRLEKFSDLHAAHASLHVFGIGESELETRISDLLYSKNPTAALYCKTGEVHINLTATAPAANEAEALLKEKERALRERIGDCLYSDDGQELHETVVHLLTDMKVRIAVAESCTGGLMASRITAVSGASKIFEYGAVTYADRAKEKAIGVDPLILHKYSAVSSVTAAEMASGVLKSAKAGIGVGITGIAGPTNEGYIDKPVGLVYVAVADKNKVLVKRFNFGSMRSRDYVRELTVLNAFDMVRRFLLGLPIEDVKQFSGKELADITREGKPKKRSSIAVEKALVSTLCAVLLLSGAFWSVQAIRARIERSVYNELQSNFTADTLSENLTALLDINADTVGWLSTDGETLDSVVVQETKDGYYDKHAFDGSASSLGCPHVNAETVLADKPQNIVVYGKASDTSALFGTLTSFSDQANLEQIYLIHFDNLSENATYKLAAVCLVNVNSAKGDTQTFFGKADFTPEELQDFVVQLKMRSVCTADTDIRSSDRFLTLVVDSDEWDGAKLVLVARELREGETADRAENAVTPSLAALYPQAYYDKTGTKSVVNETIEQDKWRSWLAANDKAATENTTADSGTTGGVGTQSGVAGSSVVDGQTVISVMVNGVETKGTPVSIVSGIVAAEMGPSYTDEALKAQAVATISWLKYNYNTTGAPEVSLGKPDSRITSLVTGVINECMTYNGEAAFTPYFAISSGKTKSSAEVFGQAYPYLVPVESAYDQQVTGYSRTMTYSTTAVKARLESYYKITLSSDPQNWVVLNGSDTSNISIDGQKTSNGYEVMQCLSLRSSDFTVKLSGTQMTFVTRGSGHGVGMSKAGANEYALELGWDYHQILQHYYTGISFGTVSW